MDYRVKLTWNGTTVLDGKATRVAASDIVRDHFAGSFAGPAAQRFAHQMGGGRLLAAIFALEPGGPAIHLEYADDSGSATAEVTSANEGATLADFDSALDAWRDARGGADVIAARAKLDALFPGVRLRPSSSATSVWAEKSPGVGFADFRLVPYRGRARDPDLTRLAYLALRALAAGMAQNGG